MNYHSNLKSFIGCHSQTTLSREIVKYCETCSELIGRNELNMHVGHNVSNNLEEKDLSQPTLKGFLLPKSTAKKEAQYYFSKDTLEVLVNQFILMRVLMVRMDAVYIDQGNDP